MKNLILITIALILFTSCSSKKKRIVIGVSQCSVDNWRDKLNKELKRETYFYDHVDLKLTSANDNNEEQIAQINRLIEQKVDLLIVSPNEARGITPVINKAYDCGIPVILVDRKTTSNKYTAFIGTDNVALGKTAGEYIARRLHGKGNIVEIRGLEGSSPATDRHVGFISALKKYPNIHLIDGGNAGWLKAPAEKMMDSVLSKTVNIDCIFGQNDRMAIGAYQSVAKNHIHKKIIFVGIDALSTSDGGINAVQKGILTATFIYPTCGDKVLELAMNILNGRKYSRENKLYTALVDKDNARILSLQSKEISDQDNKLETLHGKVDQYFTQYSNQKVYLVLFLTIIVLLFVFVAYIYKAFWTKKKLSMQLQMNNEKLKRLSEEVKEATQAKLVFFTNISHEFRTPLTLIADPIDQMLEDDKTTNAQRRYLDLMKKNVNTLLRLVNQILDFRKIENGKMKLELSKFDIISNIKEWTEEFQSSAKKKHIKLQICHEKENMDIIADKEKMESIFFNIVGNSFKYTPANGCVTISISPFIHSESPWIRICISDTGMGIKEDEIPYVFDRFYKSNNNISGTGIGLALTRALVELQNGNISVSSEYGKGTTFTIEMPERSFDVNMADVKIDTTESKNEKANYIIDAYVAETAKADEITSSEEKDLTKPTVLIVDDNNEIRQYIKLLLKEDYNVIEATDGQDGLNKAKRNIPDITVCDVMMPIMDGLQLCDKLKKDIETSHIPIILLTARSLEEQRIEGYDIGADAYISKPFSGKLLVSRIENLLKNRKILKSVFGDNKDLANEEVSDIDKDFISKFRVAVQNRLSDSDLNVEVLGADLGLSRVQMYRKIKALTTYSPVELIRITRLKKACKMLETTDMSVSETAYAVGFTSPSYFTKCFKEYFNENPNEVMKHNS